MRVGADDGLELLAVLEQLEGGHGADAQLLGDVRHGVNVDLVEARGGEFLGELGHLGRDDLAGAAPGGVGVDDHHAALLDRLAVFGEAAELVHLSSHLAGGGGEGAACGG
jgi:hypothetical protein